MFWTDVHEEVWQRETIPIVRRAMETVLTAKENLVLGYRHVDGLSYKEIAARLTLSVERVRQIDIRSLRKLRGSPWVARCVSPLPPVTERNLDAARRGVLERVRRESLATVEARAERQRRVAERRRVEQIAQQYEARRIARLAPSPAEHDASILRANVARAKWWAAEAARIFHERGSCRLGGEVVECIHAMTMLDELAKAGLWLDSATREIRPLLEAP